MQKTLMAAATAALLGMGGAATAADIYSGGGLKDVPVYAPPPLWTGFYIGGNMGIAWSQLDLNNHDFEFCKEGWWGWKCSDGSFGKGNLNSTNGFGGGQFGYNFQGGNFVGANFVYGIEVDLGAMAFNQHNHRYALGDNWPVYGVSLDARDDGGFYGDVTGRLGWTWGSALIYAKGGFAFLDVGRNLRETVFWWNGHVDTFNSNNNNDNFVTGWTVGGGIEWKVSPSWSIKAEYLHFDFSNNDNNCCNDGFGIDFRGNNFRDNAHLTADTVKLGFNYFWNPAAPAPLK